MTFDGEDFFRAPDQVFSRFESALRHEPDNERDRFQFNHKTPRQRGPTADHRERGEAS